MLKTKLTYCLLLISSLCLAQIAHYNQFPTLRPNNVNLLEENLTDISFAYSMRLLDYNYTGPLIRLRRSNDNAEQDFFPADNDIVDFTAINTWGAAANLFVVTWYDQSGLGRNASQTNAISQPQFLNIENEPYFSGDGNDDLLEVPVSIQTLTEGGKNGSIFGVFYATDRSDTAFGVVNNRNRWSTHINWRDENTYFDPGSCCQAGRSFANDVAPAGSLELWDQYSFVRRDDPTNANIDRRILRLGGEEKVNFDYDNALNCTLNVNMGISAAININGNGTSYSTTRFIEMVMYAQGKDDDFINNIEQNQINFWGL